MVLFIYLVFWDMVFLCILGWVQTDYLPTSDKAPMDELILRDTWGHKLDSVDLNNLYDSCMTTGRVVWGVQIRKMGLHMIKMYEMHKHLKNRKMWQDIINSKIMKTKRSLDIKLKCYVNHY